MKPVLPVLTCTLLLVLAACRPAVVPIPEPTVDEVVAVGAAASTDGWHRWASSSGTKTDNPRTVRVSLDLAAPTKVTYLLTNLNTSGAAIGVADVAPSLRSMESTVEGEGGLPPPNRFTRLELPHTVSIAPADLPSVPWGRSVVTPSLAVASPVVGETLTFYDAWNKQSHPTKLQFSRAVGDRTLNVWVADDCWDGNADGSTDVSNPNLAVPAPNVPVAWKSPDHLVVPGMVAALADRFLKDGADNDVHDWVTGIFGREWYNPGQTPGSGLVDSQGNLHIVLMNLNPSGTTNGTLMGYFWSGNNVLKAAGASNSNEKILFALDADSLANPSDFNEATADSWDLADFWPSETISTLAHEFQHMIHFYQKQVLLLAPSATDTWVDEMASQLAEDFVSEQSKLAIPGPRGRDTFAAGTSEDNRGRLSEFNGYHDRVALTAWSSKNPLPNYAQSYAFGAWLARNYGGPDLLRRVVQSRGTNGQAIVDAANASTGRTDLTWGQLVRDWGLATFLSSNSVNDGLRFSAPASASPFAWTLGSQPFRLGDINLATYRQVTYSSSGAVIPGALGPKTHTALSAGDSVPAGTTYILEAGTLKGKVRRTLVLPAQVQLTVVTTP